MLLNVWKMINNEKWQDVQWYVIIDFFASHKLFFETLLAGDGHWWLLLVDGGHAHN